MSRKLPLSPTTATEADFTIVQINPDGSSVAMPAANADGSVKIAGVGGTTAASATNPAPVASTPNTLASSGVAPVAITAVGGSQILKASAGNLYGFNVAAGASAGYLLVFNSATVPADGAVTPVKAYAIAANASLEVTYDTPRRLSAGGVLVFSTTGPYLKTISATAFLSGEMV